MTTSASKKIQQDTHCCSVRHPRGCTHHLPLFSSSPPSVHNVSTFVHSPRLKSCPPSQRKTWASSFDGLDNPTDVEISASHKPGPLVYTIIRQTRETDTSDLAHIYCCACSTTKSSCSHDRNKQNPRIAVGLLVCAVGRHPERVLIFVRRKSPGLSCSPDH